MEELEPNIHQVPREAPLTVALGIVTAGTAMSENGRSFEHFVSTRTQPLGMGAAGLAAVMWGIGGVFAVLTTVSGLEVTVYRLWMGVILLGALSFGSGKRINWPAFKVSWLGGLLLAADMALYFNSVKCTNIVDVSVIGSFQPALILISARRFFNERLKPTDVVWIVVAMVGVVIAVLGPGVATKRQFFGDALAVGSLVFWSAFWLVSKRTRQSLDTVRYTFSATLWAAVFITPVAALSGTLIGHMTWPNLYWIALIAIVPGGGDLAMNWAHRFVDASISSAITCLSPVVAGVTALVVLGQPLTLVEGLGGVVGLTAIAILASRHRQPLETPLE